MLLGVGLMLLGHGGAWLLAIALQKRLNLSGTAANVTGAFVLHELIVTLVVLVAGSAHVLGPWALAAGGILSGCAGLALGARLPSVRGRSPAAASCVASRAWPWARDSPRLAESHSPPGGSRQP